MGIDPDIRIAIDAQRDFSQKAFRAGCYAPYVSLFFTTEGDVLACCKNWAYPLGNVATRRLPDIWHGRQIRALRDGLKDYRFEGDCKFCEWQFAGKDATFQSAFPANFEWLSVDSEEPAWPQMIEFSGSNYCNFECIMCSGEFSSAIRANREKLPPLPKMYGDQFFEDLRLFLPHLRLAKFLGGEPFLAPECFRIWDMILEDGLSTPCHVTTNGSQFTPKVERVLNALPVSVTISLDGATRETVERIRVNCKYDELMRNIRRFREYTSTRGTFMSFAHCLMRDNWHEFADLLLFAEDLGSPVFVNTVLGPPERSLYKLPAKELSVIVEAMEARTSEVEGKLPINSGVWKAQLAALRASSLSAAQGPFPIIDSPLQSLL